MRLPCAPLRSINDLVNDEQLMARGYFVEVEHPELGRKFLYPGAPYLFSGTPWRLYRRPPLLGEHNKEILTGELGIAIEELGGAARGRGVLKWRWRWKASGCSISPGWWRGPPRPGCWPIRAPR